MESAIDQIYDDFERECEHELWWIKSKERGLGFKAVDLKKLDGELFQVVQNAVEDPVEQCRKLIESGGSCDFVDGEGTSVIHTVTVKGFPLMLEMLLIKFPDEIERKTRKGRSPLQLALNHGRVNGIQNKCWRLLIQHGAINQIRAYLTASNTDELSFYLRFISERSDFKEIIGTDLNQMKLNNELASLERSRIAKFNEDITNIKGSHYLSYVMLKYCFHDAFVNLPEPVSDVDEILAEYEKIKEDHDSLLLDNRELQSENEVLGQCDSQLKSEIETLSKSLQKLTDDSTELISSNHQLTNNNNELQAQNMHDSLQRQYDNSIVEYKKFENEVQDLKQKARAADEEVSAIKDECDTLMTSNDTLTVINQNLESDNAALIAKSDTLATEKIELCESQESLITRINELEQGQLDSAKGDSVAMDQLKKDNDQLKNAIKEQKSENETLSLSVSDMSQMKAQLDMSKKSYIHLTMQLNEAKQANIELTSKLNSSSESTAELEHDLSESNETIKQLTDQLELSKDLNMQLEDAKQANTELASQLELSTEAANGLRGDLSHSRETIHELNDKITLSNDRFNDLTLELEEVKRTNTELTQLQDQFTVSKDSINDEEIETLRADAEKVKSENETLLEKLKESANETDRLTVELEQRHIDYKELEELNLHDLSEAQETIKQLNNQITVATTGDNDLIMQLEELKQANSELTSEIKSSSERTNGLLHDLSQSNEKVTELEYSQTTVANTGNDDLLMELEELKEANSELTSKINSSSERTSELLYDLTQSNDRVKELEYSQSTVSTEEGVSNELMESLRTDAQLVKAENQTLHDEMQQSVSENQRLTLELENINADYKELDDNWKVEMETLTMENRTLQHKCTQLTNNEDVVIELKNCTEENAALAESYNNLHEQHKLLQDEKTTLTDQLNDRKTQHSILSAENESLSVENDSLNRTVQDFRATQECLSDKYEQAKAANDHAQLENTALKARLLKTVNETLSSPPVDTSKSDADIADLSEKNGSLSNENDKLIQNNLHLASEMQKISAENETLMDENGVLKKYLDDINLLSSQLYSYSRIK